MTNNLSHEVDIAFRIIGVDLDPPAISDLMEMQPDKSCRRGDPIFGKNGEIRGKSPCGLWSLRKYCSIAEIQETLLEFSNRLKSKEDSLLELRTLGYKTDLFIGIFTDSIMTNLTLSSESLRWSVAIGAVLDVNFYYQGEWSDAAQ